MGGFIFAGLTLVASGVVVGALQWFVLQGRISHPWRWALASAAGWTVGYSLVVLLNPVGFELLSVALLGLAVGVAQWLVLRGELYWAGWWIPFSIMGWITGLTLLPGFLLTGTMAGGLTGLAMEVLLRSPKPRKPII